MVAVPPAVHLGIQAPKDAPIERLPFVREPRRYELKGNVHFFRFPLGLFLMMGRKEIPQETQILAFGYVRKPLHIAARHDSIGPPVFLVPEDQSTHLNFASEMFPQFGFGPDCLAVINHPEWEFAPRCVNVCDHRDAPFHISITRMPQRLIHSWRL
jgi:hypothetical protein